jgi:lysophospholipase L1-like esterase
VPIDASFTQVTTELLGGRAAGLEGIAAALPGYSTLQLLNLLELRAADLEPDLLVVAALWSDNATAAVGDAALLDRYQRWDLGTAGAADRLLRRSALVRVLTWELSVRRGAQARARADYSTAVPHPDGHQHRVPVADYRQNLDSLAAIARDRDAAIAFVVLPHPEDLEERTRGVSSFHAYRDAMRGAAQDHDAPLVEGGELFARAAADDSGLDRDALFLDNIHPSILGHRLLGDALAPALEAWERQTRP